MTLGSAYCPVSVNHLHSPLYASYELGIIEDKFDRGS